MSRITQYQTKRGHLTEKENHSPKGDHNMFKKTLMAAGLIGIIALAAPTAVHAEESAQVPMSGQMQILQQRSGMNDGFGGMQGMPGMNGDFGGMQDMGGMTGNMTLADSPSEIVEGITGNSAASLVVDEENAVTVVMSDENSNVKIDSAGTFIVTGTCSEGNITVKKGTTGVVLILKDLDLTSTTGATVSCNKNTEVKIVIEGTVKLTDAEDPADEDSEDAEVADAFDGAALKVKDGAATVLTGTGTLNIDASACKNGIKVGNEDEPSLVIDGSLTVNITAANDAINSGYDLAILNGTLNISAGDDAVHADRILTVGEDGNGPSITISSCVEGLEGTVVNLFGGNVTLTANDDGINAANSDGTYADIGYSINITGGTYNVKAGGDGLDSNGNINLIGGYTVISSASVGGEAGIDYDGSCYIAEGTINNLSGISGPDGAPGQGMNGTPGEMNNGQGMNGFPGEMNNGQQSPFRDEQSWQDRETITEPEEGSEEKADKQDPKNEQINQPVKETAEEKKQDTTKATETVDVSDSTEDDFVVPVPETKTRPVYRLYNPGSGEHFFTVSSVEKETLINDDWTDEGVAFSVPERSDTPVYRLFNAETGEHFYTASETGIAIKEAEGFTCEGIAWYTDDAESMMVYRLRNTSQKGSAHYTANLEERATLVAGGWTEEATGFCVK